MKKGIKIGVITLLLLLTGCTIGGSFFMLNYSLRPEAKIGLRGTEDLNVHACAPVSIKLEIGMEGPV